jgi:DNA repair protein RecO (recombination protein O)
MEWEAPAIVLDARRYGEADVIATLMTEAHGAHRGLVRGGAGRSRAAVWQPGNLVQARWVGRLADQLGQFTGELVHPAAALAMEDELSLAMLAAACAVAEGALAEREAHPRVFDGLLHLIARLGAGRAMLAEQVRWEVLLLAELGYGLDLGACALSGSAEDLAYVSPRTGRAVGRAAAGDWAARLLPLPPFLLAAQVPAEPGEWRDGLRLTGHFLARDVFGGRHRPLPAARLRLYDLVSDLAGPPAPVRDGTTDET